MGTLRLRSVVGHGIEGPLRSQISFAYLFEMEDSTGWRRGEDTVEHLPIEELDLHEGQNMIATFQATSVHVIAE